MSDTSTSNQEQITYPVTERAFGLAIVALGGMQLMAVLDGTVVNLALAPLQADLGLSDAGRTWVISSYVLAFGGLMLLGGRLGDAFGRRRMFFLGVSLFTFASAACGLAQNEEMLVFARCIQGAGAAVASPTAFALVATTFAPGKVRNQAIAIYAAMTGVGSFGGLIIGGALTQVSWRWIFLINLPIGLLILAVGARSLVEARFERKPLDIPGSVLATIGSTAVVFGLVEAPGRGWGDPLIVSSFILGVVLLGAFLVVQRTSKNPLLPLGLFNDRNRVFTFIAIFFSGAVMFAMTVTVALLVQDVLKYTPLEAGLAFIPFGIGMGVSAAIAQWLAQRIPPRHLVAIGCTISIVNLIYSSTITIDSSYWPHLAVPILGIGLGVGLSVVALPLCAIANVPMDQVGPLTAIALVGQNIGGPLGLAVISAIGAARTVELGGRTGSAVGMDRQELIALGDGYTLGLLGCAVITLLVALAAQGIRYTADDVAQAKAAQDASLA